MDAFLSDQLALIWAWFKSYPFVMGLALVAGSLVTAKLVDLLFSKMFNYISLRTRTDLDDEVTRSLHRPIQLTVLLVIAAAVAGEMLKEHAFVDDVVRGIYSAIIVLYTWALLRVSQIIFRHFTYSATTKTGWRQLMPLFNNITTLLIFLHAAYVLLSLWSVNVTPLIASAGIVTAVVALASKDTVANFFGGISIFVDRPYQLGDYVVLDSNERGEVVSIGMRSTRILTRDDVLISVPNSEMANRKIVNQSGQVPRYRIRVKVGTSYDAHPDLVERELLASLEGVAGLMPEPKPRVRFREFGDSSLAFELLVWIHWPADQGRIIHEINKNIYNRFKSAGIEIPFPQRVVHLRHGEKPPANLED